jgi:hypothetical protein
VISADGVSWGPSGDLSGEGVCRYARRVSAMLSGYARCSTDEQDLTGQRLVLLGLGVAEDRIYLVKGLTAPTGPGPACPGPRGRAGRGHPPAEAGPARPLDVRASVMLSSPVGCGCCRAGRSTTGPTRWGGCFQHLRHLRQARGRPAADACPQGHGRRAGKGQAVGKAAEAVRPAAGPPRRVARRRRTRGRRPG